MAKITFINKTDKTQVFQKHSYGFMTIKPGETVDLYLDYTKDITTKAFIKSFYSPYESIFDITYSFDVVDVSNALKFSSDSDFTLSAHNKWDGTLEYTTDNGNTWIIWDGSQLSGTAEQPIYIRGTGNTKVSASNSRWTFSGKYCEGNIENLLDYQTVANGEHPVMTTWCYCGMFQGCTSLVTTPKLPATNLSKYCYYNMFKGCTSITTPPELPATTAVQNCYSYMFQDCTSLTTAPELPATTLADSCYSFMFQGCTSLKISTTKTGDYKYEYRIPMTGTVTQVVSRELAWMFGNTGGTFTETPEINTTYYTDHEPV